MSKRRSCVLALALCVLGAAQALEIKQGIIKLVVDESNASVSIYKLIDIGKQRYEPLLFDQDPRTSYATLSFDGRQYKLGDSADYRFTVKQVEGGARVEFRSSSCVVTEDLAFVSSADAALADGVLVTYTLQNVSQRDASIGLRVLLDTWLGEKSFQHFRTDLRPKVGDELALDSRSGDAWISSPGERADLMIQVSGNGLTRPDQIVFANWKRLSDEAWSMDPVVGRSFTLLPYSVNDSAVSLYWQPAMTTREVSRSLSFVLGCFNEKGFLLKGKAAESDTAALFAKTVLQAAAADTGKAMQSDLLIARDLVSNIDQALASGKPLTAEQVDAWRKILAALEERKKGY